MKRPIPLLAMLLFLVSSCREAAQVPASIPELDHRPASIIISQIQAGEAGNNQADFIELYNSGTEIADLKGYSLWYQLNDSSEEVLLIQWDRSVLIPPLGFYALALEGQEFPLLPDAFFIQPLVPNRGGLSLRQGSRVMDQAAWGTGPADMAEGSLAPAMSAEKSLGRRIGEVPDQELDRNDNQADFRLASDPELQNTGSPLNHPSGADLSYSLELPPVIQPGSSFSAELQIENQTGSDLQDLQVHLTIPDQFQLAQESPVIISSGQTLTFRLPLLGKGQSHSGVIPLIADYTFTDFGIHNSFLEVENWPLPAFSGPVYGEIGGGPIPIARARTLIDKEVIVEGVSTMYVGGFYAGSGAKFYVEDGSGGIQVYVAGAGSSLSIPLGATVQVRGKVEIYRDSLELVPASEDDVQIIASPEDSPERPPELTAIENLNAKPDDFLGKLIEVEGLVARIEEFPYSYGMDLADSSGSMVTLYIDKNTGITVEEIEPDQYYRTAGIMELYDGNYQLYPRLQSDLSRVYPPGLYIQVQTPTTVQVGEDFTASYQVTNHSPNGDQNLVITAPLDPGLEVLEIQQEGRTQNGAIIWEIKELSGGGGEIELGFTAQLKGNTEYVTFRDFSVVSPAWPEPAGGITSYTIAGETVPIWAVQGTGGRSPYILSQVSCEGVVTGIFPELEGFWIQETASDMDPSTSPGVFINTGPSLPDLSPGELVRVTGRVRESYQQTQLDVSSPARVESLGKGTLPSAVILDPPAGDQESTRYYEALEGALVSVPGPALVVGPTTTYGEFALVLPKHNLSRVWQDADHGRLIHVDDGSSATLEYRDALPSAVAVGDTLYQLAGPLAYTYGNYKIEPTATYRVENQPLEAPTLPETGEGVFSLMTWNVENLFDFLVPHPSSPPLPRVSEYKLDISKVAQTIRAAGFPTVIGLQEVENLEILEDISADPLLLEYSYQAYLIEGTDSRGIDVGYLVRGDRAQVLDLVQYQSPKNITSRPPLLLVVALAEDPGSRLYLLNNHFTSMSGGELATEPRRAAQASWNLEIAQELLERNPGAYLAIMGDLNSYYGSLPIRTLESGRYSNVFDYLEPEERYTYVYQGLSQVLDHILVNDDLESLLLNVEVLHCNADYPLPSSDQADYIHKSDHDPLVAFFALP